MLQQRIRGVRIRDNPAQGAVEQSEGLEGLPQIVAGRGQKAAFCLIRPIGAVAGQIGEIPHGLRGIACHDEFSLNALAIGHIADGSRDQNSIRIFDGA